MNKNGSNYDIKYNWMEVGFPTNEEFYYVDKIEVYISWFCGDRSNWSDITAVP